MRKVSFELPIGYQKKKKKKDLKNTYNIKCASKTKKKIDIKSIWLSLGKSKEGPMTIEPGIERRQAEKEDRKRQSLFYR